MRILIDAHVFDDKYQGTRSYLKGLYSQLIPIAKDWHFFLLAGDIDNIRDEFGRHQNVTYVALKSKNKFYRLLVELPLIIKKHKIDYAHYQYVSPIIKNCKQIVTIHDILFEQDEFKKYFPIKYRLINGFLFRFSAKRADILLTVSEYSKKKIAEIYKVKYDSIGITPNAVNDKYFENLLPNAISNIGLDKYILYVSRVEPRKNHLTLLKAFVGLGLALKGYKLVLIGKKDIVFKDLAIYIEEIDSKHSQAIIWIENVSNEELMAYYKNCELFVFPSFAEGFGIPPLEAMAVGCKLLCSKTTVMADFNLPDPLTFNPYDIEELKLKIMVQLNNNKVELDIYKEVLAKYNWEKIAKDYVVFLNERFNNK